MTRNEFVHMAMINSFDVLVGNRSFMEIVDSGDAVFLFRPSEGIGYEDLELMLEYFEEEEMFEECKHIKNIIDNLPDEDHVIMI
jgi:hypothetical protein